MLVGGHISHNQTSVWMTFLGFGVTEAPAPPPPALALNSACARCWYVLQKMGPASIGAVSGMLFESTRRGITDESPITYPSYAKQLHPMYYFRWSASNLQVPFLCSERWGYCFFPC